MCNLGNNPTGSVDPVLLIFVYARDVYHIFRSLCEVDVAMRVMIYLYIVRRRKRDAVCIAPQYNIAFGLPGQPVYIFMVARLDRAI